ncbi:MAG: M4 family metallopeptidase [bacterium]
MTCTCFIIPQDVLRRLASDAGLSEELRANFAHTAAISERVRAVRDQQIALTLATLQLPPLKGVTAFPIPVPHVVPPSHAYDCQHGTTLPGTPITNPGGSHDGTVKRACDEAEAVAKFYWDIFGRDSIDAHHMTLVSSVHYSTNFNNAFWNGSQMTYGDGDGQIFVDFTLGNDVIAHELTHGVTQHSAGFVYANEAGGLNESMSDVFGSMFRQWQGTQSAHNADWLIGRNVMGPTAIGKGFTCLRDMANPAAPHCLAPQPTHFSQYHAGMDPHYSSGIPNLAFFKAATAAAGQNGHSWDQVGQIWYQALTGFPPNPNMLMSAFANRTRSVAHGMYPTDAHVQKAVNDAWIAVGL